MSQISSGIVGVMAAIATFGAIQYAAGSDLRGTFGVAGQAAVETASIQETAGAVNRAAKGDRMTSNSAGRERGQTMSFEVQGLSATSVLLHLAPIPVRTETIVVRPSPVSVKTLAAGEKSAVACEPPVSVLSEVAKLLQPGRCVT
ncbi:hypothetical protein [Tardiphaga sp.]|uniref:hypothetical protein n=1 Tax=Tardiphaga sp. TaxID=1926292 RepID=UPI0025FCB87A|nr:hypothetical protein [Tardiphaga sp.]